MVDFEGLKDKAENLAEEHAEQVDSAIDKAADFLGAKVGHEAQIEQGAEKLKSFLPGGEDDAKP